MKRGFWITFALFILIVGFASADSFSFTSGNGGFSIGGLSGGGVGFFTSPNSSNATAPSPTPTPSPGSGGSGGGGGGTVTLQPIPNLVVNPSSFNLPASVGIESSGEIMLKNNGTSNISGVITIGTIGGIISFNQSNFTLAPGKSRILVFSITPPDKAGIYSGKILFSSQGYQTVVPIALDVGQGQSLFDIFVIIPQEYRVIQQGQNLVSNISLVQKGVQKKTDVTVEYTIQDFSGNTFSSKTNTVAVYNEKDYQESFNTSSLLPGNYLIGVKAIYSGGIATASSTFTINPVPVENANETNKTAPSSNRFFSSIGGFFRKVSSEVGGFFSSVGAGFKSLSGKVGDAFEAIHFGIVLLIAGILAAAFGLFLLVKLIIKNFFAWKSKYKIWKYSR